MFAKTFSFWQRLVGTAPTPSSDVTPAGDTATATHDDRRLWVRYTANLPAKVEAADATISGSAVVRDLSLGGANLLVEQPFQAGQLVSIALPASDDDACTVLACVVRVAPEGAGRWSLGCVFARELSADDLERFGASRVKHDAADQRTWVRFRTELRAEYQVVGDPENATHPACVLNISASGVGLEIESALEAGSLLNVDLLDRQGRPVRSILACAVHTTRRAGGALAVGCNFIRELTEDELEALLQ